MSLTKQNLGFNEYGKKSIGKRIRQNKSQNERVLMEMKGLHAEDVSNGVIFSLNSERRCIDDLSVPLV